MHLKEYLASKGVWTDGFCLPSYSQAAGSFSNMDINLDSKQINLFIQEKYGRFGNNVHQVLHALIVARELAIKSIFCNFYLDDTKTESIIIDDIVLKFGIEAAPEMPLISGTMFYLQGFEKFIENLDYQSIKSDAERLGRGMSLRGQTTRQVNEKNLVVFHFRSGDIFSTDVNPIYTQPPLSYYIIALEHILETLKEPTIYLVYENKLNPCIEKFQDHLDVSKIRYKNQSLSFKEDAGLIASANTIVSSYSSFCDMLALMNEDLCRWYAFRSAAAFECVDLSLSNSFSGILGGDGIDVYLVNDDQEKYTPMGQWGHSADCIEQLLNYPMCNLSIRLVNKSAQS